MCKPIVTQNGDKITIRHKDEAVTFNVKDGGYVANKVWDVWAVKRDNSS